MRCKNILVLTNAEKLSDFKAEYLSSDRHLQKSTNLSILDLFFYTSEMINE